ncbi:MAG: hypothetical protein IID44_19685 [Planctomycetes bacterium]|nr:hypothetical protein [Planctomycetota bacterium]
MATPGLAAGAAGVATLGGPGFVAAGFDVSLHAGLEAANASGCDFDGCDCGGLAVFEGDDGPADRRGAEVEAENVLRRRDFGDHFLPVDRIVLASYTSVQCI